MPEYLLILILLTATAVVLHKSLRLKIFQSTKHILIFFTIVLIIGSVWDQFAIARGHWTFQEEFLLGPKIGHMPIEEYRFILVVGYFGLVMYRATEKIK